jgi:tripartite-type tricarboxylate transporter receptor subunit TctC
MNKFQLLTLFISAGLVATAVPAAGALAQTYPVKPVRIIIGFSSGGGGDVSGRLLAQKMAASLGQPVIVENRVGAGGAIASELVAKAPADGHTLLFAAGAFAALPALRAKLPFDTERDFAPVSLVVITAFVLSVHPSVPVHDVKALIALARSRPGVLTFSSPGVGSSAHLAGELFNMMAQINMLHVPFKGSPEAATAVAAGEIDVGMPSVSAITPLIAAGKLRAIAVTGAKRSALFPTVPTLDESGLRGYDRGGWNGVFAPAGVPRDVIVQLNDLIGKIVNTPEMTDLLRKLGFEPRTGTPEQFAAFVRNEMVQNAKLVKFAGLNPN